MKTLIVIVLLLAMPAFGEPASKITVVYPNGITSTYNGEEYTVVLRHPKTAKASASDQALKECQTSLKRAAAEKISLEEERGALLFQLQEAPLEVIVQQKVLAKPNRVTLAAGVGPDGVTAKATADGQVIKPRLAPLFGLGYSRRLTDEWSLGGQLMSGVTTQSSTIIGTLGLGYDF